MSADVLSLGQCSISLGVWQHGVRFVPGCSLCLWFCRYLGLFVARFYTLVTGYGSNHEPGPAYPLPLGLSYQELDGGVQ